MSDQFEKYEEIERVIAGKGDAALNERLAQDEDFAQEVQFHRSLQDAILDEKAFEMDALLQEVEAEVLSQSKGKLRPMNRFRILLRAVAACIVLGLAIWGVLNVQSNTSEEVFANYFQPYEFGKVIRGENQDMEQKLKQALGYYDQENFEKALPLFQELAANDTKATNFQFYSGICLLGLKKSKEAIASFEKVNQANDRRLQAPAEWYLALAYLQLGQREEAQKRLQQIIENNTVFSQLASQVLQEL